MEPYTGPLPEHPPEGKCKCGGISMERGISVFMDLDWVLHRREGCGDKADK